MLTPLLAPPDTLSTFQPIDAMLGEIASLVGGEDDPDCRALALRKLDEAAGRVNLATVGLWTLREATPTVTAGTATVTLPSDWGWPYGDARFEEADGDVARYVKWVTWDVWYGLNSARADSDLPAYISIRNEVRDGTAYLYPTPNTEAAAYTLKLPYLTRIQRPSEASTLYLTDELRTVLVAGGQALLARHRFLQQPAIWAPLQQDFHLLLQQYRAAADRLQSLGGSLTSFGTEAGIGTSNVPSTWIKVD